LPFFGKKKKGKTSFINFVRSCTKQIPISLSISSYMQKHTFENVNVDNNTGEKNFSILDVMGCDSDFLEWKSNKKLVDLIFKGLKDGSCLTNDLSRFKMDSSNALTHVIITFNGRAIFAGINWSNWWYSKTVEDTKINEIYQLYHLVIEDFKNTKLDELDAKTRVIVLITHLDMIPLGIRKNFQNDIIQILRKKYHRTISFLWERSVCGMRTNFVPLKKLAEQIK